MLPPYETEAQKSAPARAPVAKAEPKPMMPTPAKTQPSAPAKKPEAKQETLQFEPVSRGRFEKSEPTIIDGQDLDVPTFLRKNVKVR
jgi:cell division protein FtsZ